MNILAELRKRFETALESLTADAATFAAMVRAAKDSRFGDYQANCAMPLAKQNKTNPRELASQIVERLDVNDLCDPPEIAGPGFINLRLRDNWLSETTNGMVNDERLGHVATAQPRKYVIDYSAPNVAKPMHVGHLRSTVIGHSLCQILRFQGHESIGDNHIGDWGTQFGMIIFGYKNFVDNEAYASEPVEELARLYRLVSQLSTYHQLSAEQPELIERLQNKESELATADAAAQDKKAKKTLKRLRASVGDWRNTIDEGQKKIENVDASSQLKSLADKFPDIADQARQETAKLHAGDTENFQLWNEFVPKCLEALDKIYDRVDITFELTLGESFYQPQLCQIVDDLQTRQMAKESQGAICVFIEGNEAPFLIRKRDGAFTYATTDLATIRYRVEELHADSILYVVDMRQSQHFEMLFETARRWGYDQVEFKHVSFGTIMGDDNKPFKTRSGDIVELGSLLDEAVSRARKIVDQNDDAKPNGPELDDEARAAVARSVGIGGTKYVDLHHNRESDYIFSWDKMLATKGDTGAYIQYAVARICGIFRKGKISRADIRSSGGTIQLNHPAERALAIQLIRFAETIDAAMEEYRPNFLTEYLFETANTIATFYVECPILHTDVDESTRNSRLLLCDTVARGLELGLSLLGIQTHEMM